MTQKEIGVNITYQVELARRSNYSDLHNTIKQDIIQSRMKDVDLFVSILNGDIDKETTITIDNMLKNGEIDSMYIPKY